MRLPKHKAALSEVPPQAAASGTSRRLPDLTRHLNHRELNAQPSFTTGSTLTAAAPDMCFPSRRERCFGPCTRGHGSPRKLLGSSVRRWAFTAHPVLVRAEPEKVRTWTTPAAPAFPVNRSNKSQQGIATVSDHRSQRCLLKSVFPAPDSTSPTHCLPDGDELVLCHP